jgi:hypothetical protein
MKNVIAEFSAAPLGIFDDLFVQLSEGYKQCVAG